MFWNELPVEGSSATQRPTLPVPELNTWQATQRTCCLPGGVGGHFTHLDDISFCSTIQTFYGFCKCCLFVQLHLMGLNEKYDDLRRIESFQDADKLFTRFNFIFGHHQRDQLIHLVLGRSWHHPTPSLLPLKNKDNNQHAILRNLANLQDVTFRSGTSFCCSANVSI